MGAFAGSAEQGPRRGVSLRAQLTFWFLAISLVIHVTLMAVLLVYQRLRAGEPAGDRLLSYANAAGAFVAGAGAEVTDDSLSSFRESSRIFPSDVPRALAVFDAAGRLVASTQRPAPRVDLAARGALDHAEPPVVVAQRVPALRSADGDDECLTALVRVSGHDGSPRLVWAAANDARLSLAIPPRVLVSVLTAEVIAIAIAGWMIAGLAIRPITHLRNLTASLAPETLEQDIRTTARAREIVDLERDLRDTRAKLRSALHAQDRFLSNVSHELKTPIAILLTEAQTLPPESFRGEASKFVSSVTEEMRRLGRMMDSFLMLTRVRGGGSIPNPRPYDVNEFVLEALGDCQVIARRANVELAARFAENGRPLRVTGDPELLRVMTHNLIRNALRHSPEGGKVAVTVSDRGDACDIAVRDFGEKIPGEFLDRVFDHSSRTGLHPPITNGEPSREAPGECVTRSQGLGLAIAQGIAELHAGRIIVANVESGGCEFTVRLPVSAGHPADDAQSHNLQ